MSGKENRFSVRLPYVLMVKTAGLAALACRRTRSEGRVYQVKTNFRAPGSDINMQDS